MRERAYVTQIKTPLKTYDFTISPRFDIDHDYFKTPLNKPSGVNLNFAFLYSHALYQSKPGAFNIEYPMELMKYDLITIKDNISNEYTNTIELNYAINGGAKQLAQSDYMILNNDGEEDIAYDPSDLYNIDSEGNNTGFVIDAYKRVGMKRGKTTLLGIKVYPKNLYPGSDYKEYKFDYGFNPSYNAFQKHKILQMEVNPPLRASNQSDQERWAYPNFISTLLPFKLVLTTTQNNQGVQSLKIEESYSSISKVKDEMGYYHDASRTNKGRDAWSLTKVTYPYGGTLELEYELDEFEINDDMNALKANGSIIHDALPSVESYNKMASIKSIWQSCLNTLYSHNTKKLNSCFSMPMNANSGGLRLKSKTIDHGVYMISPKYTVNYEYGNGHYTSVPGEYWRNYLEAFSSFMAYEKRNQEGEGAYINALLSTFVVYDMNVNPGVKQP